MESEAGDHASPRLRGFKLSVFAIVLGGLLSLVSLALSDDLGDVVSLLGLVLYTAALVFFTHEITCGLHGGLSARRRYPCYTALIVIFWLFTVIHLLLTLSAFVFSGSSTVLRVLRLGRILPLLALIAALIISILRWRQASQALARPIVTVRPLIAMPLPGGVQAV